MKTRVTFSLSKTAIALLAEMATERKRGELVERLIIAEYQARSIPPLKLCPAALRSLASTIEAK